MGGCRASTTEDSEAAGSHVLTEDEQGGHEVGPTLTSMLVGLAARASA
jgi:hypothetical protein